MENAIVSTEWTPSEDFNTGLTADDWKQILEDDTFIKTHPIGSIALWLYYKSDTPLSYTELAKKYGRNEVYYSGGTTQFTTAVASKFKEKINPFKDKTGKIVYWYLSFVSRKTIKEELGSFILKLRKEVREGFNKISDECKRKFEEMYMHQMEKEIMNKETNFELNSKQKEWLGKLQKSHQIILTGAPGTGKSYAAHEIANALTENKAKNIEFVQFHPSMDYTDFVEGLRPIKENGQITFERKDGIFKSFCKKALENWLNAQKTENVQKEEQTLEKEFDDFIDEAIENGNLSQYTFQLKSGAEFRVVDRKEKCFIFEAPHIKSQYGSLSYKKLLDAYSYFCIDKKESLKEAKQIKDYLYPGQSRSEPSYILPIIQKFDEFRKNKKNTFISTTFKKINKENFVFIIDEINRGDISKIFGELFFAIDPSYRGEKGKITTQYQNLVESDDLYADGFFIPENVYIIGTMNDIDRGVESMDFAIRRRFTWIEVEPEDTQSMLDSLDEQISNKAKEKMSALNKIISDNPALGKAYQIGGAYFLKLKDLNNNFDDLWKYHLEPLLREYLRNDPQTEDVLNEMKKAYDTDE